VSPLRRRADVQGMAQARRAVRTLRLELSLCRSRRWAGVLLAMYRRLAADLRGRLAASRVRAALVGPLAHVVSAADRRLPPAAAPDQGLAGCLAIRAQGAGGRHPGTVGQAARRRVSRPEPVKNS